MDVQQKPTENEGGLVKAEPKDVFMHLFVMIMLYASAINFLVLVFQYIGILIPDVLQNDYYALQSAYGTIRWSVASLIVIFPVYIWAMWFLSKSYTQNPLKKHIKIRKWLIYLTLFFAALIIIGDLVTLIFNLLGGEFTTRFLLKVLAVFFVAGSIFGYYLNEIRERWSPNFKKIFVYAVIVIVIVIVAIAFFIVGSPQEARLRQLDDRRVSDLQSIQSEIIQYWQAKQVLPENVSMLQDLTRGIIIPKDPTTGADYGYVVNGATDFQLCATFDRPSLDQSSSQVQPRVMTTQAVKPVPAAIMGYDSQAQIWKHDIGYTCFDRKIDRDFFPPLPVKY